MSDAVERLEAWQCGNKARSVKIHKDDGYGASCWVVEFRHEHGNTQAYEAQFFTSAELSAEAYLVECAKLGTVFVKWNDDDDSDETWPGLTKTIDAAIEAFNKGIWKPRDPVVADRLISELK